MPPPKKFSCQFPNCNNGYYWCKNNLERVQNKHFYRFPTNSAVNIKWKKICGIKLTENCRNKYVCEDHFQKEDFVNFTKHALNPFVVPSRLQSDSNLLSEVSISSQNKTVNYSKQLNSTNLITAFNDLNIISIYSLTNNTSIVNQGTVDNISSKIDSKYIVSKDVFSNLNTEQNLNTHTESVNNDSLNNHLYTHEQDCICENAKCQRDDNSDDNDTVITNNLTECNEILLKKQRKTGFLTEAGVSLKAMTPTKRRMYKIHRRTINKLSKVKKSLYNQKDTIKKLKKLSKDNVFQCMENQLNTVTQNFIDSQLRNIDRDDLFSTQCQHHLFTTFKEHDGENDSLTYASIGYLH